MTASAATWSRYAGFFVPEDARVGTLAQLRAYAASRSRYAGECPLFSAWGASRTEPPLRVTASAVEVAAS